MTGEYVKTDFSIEQLLSEEQEPMNKNIISKTNQNQPMELSKRTSGLMQKKH